jgi:hypothetical protein
MALETNANIPSAYVYQAADIGGKMESAATRKEAKIKYDLEQKKALKTKNDAALAGVKVAKADLTPDATLNEAILKRADQIMDTYSEAGANELPVYDATSPIGKALQSDINSLHEFQARMAGISNEMKGINNIKGADNDIFNYFHDKITGNPTIDGIQDTIKEYNDYKDLLTAVPNVASAVKTSVESAGTDQEILDLQKADFSKKSSDEILSMEKKVNEQDIPRILADANSKPEIQKARAIFEFKKEKGILDAADYNGYDDFDDYLKDMVLNKVALKTSTGELYKDPKSQNIIVKINNTNQTPAVGQTAITGDVSIANSPFDFNNVTYDLAGGTTNGTIELKKKDGTKYTQADVDAMNSTIPDALKQKYVYSLNGNGNVEVNSDVLGLSSAGEQMTITESLNPNAAMSPKPYKDTSGNIQNGQIQSIRHTASGDLVGILTGGDTAELDDDVFVFLWSDKPNLKTIAKANALNFANQLNANVSDPDMWTFWNSNGAKFK